MTAMRRIPTPSSLSSAVAAGDFVCLDLLMIDGVAYRGGSR